MYNPCNNPCKEEERMSRRNSEGKYKWAFINTTKAQTRLIE